MLTIKRHFPINRLALSKAWYSTKHFVGDAGHSLKAGVASLRDRSHSMGKKSILSSLVVLVGFFGSLSALLILYPIATQPGGPLSASSPQANVESQTGPSVTETWMKDDEPAAGANDSSAAPAGQTSPIATSPVPAPASPAAPAPAPAGSVPAPVVQAAPVAPQPVLRTAPSSTAPSPMTTAPAPAPSTSTSPLPSAPAPTGPAPIISTPSLNAAPLTDATDSTVQTVDGMTSGLLN